MKIDYNYLNKDYLNVVIMLRYLQIFIFFIILLLVIVSVIKAIKVYKIISRKKDLDVDKKKIIEYKVEDDNLEKNEERLTEIDRIKSEEDSLNKEKRKLIKFICCILLIIVFLLLCICFLGVIQTFAYVN